MCAVVARGPLGVRRALLPHLLAQVVVLLAQVVVLLERGARGAV